MNRAASAYAKVGVESAVISADPHRLILMLFDGAKSAISTARLQMENNEIAEKGRNISKAIDIIANGLKASLNVEEGGDLAQNLLALYDYMCNRLLWANQKNDLAALDEVTMLLNEIREAWAEISPNKLAAQSSEAAA